MLQNFMFAFNAIMPILLLMLLGYVMRRKGILTPNTAAMVGVTSTSRITRSVIKPCLIPFPAAIKIGEIEVSA